MCHFNLSGYPDRVKSSFFCIAFVVAILPIHGQQTRHRAVRFDEWLLDLETLSLADTSQQRNFNLVWDVNAETGTNWRWSYQDHTSAEVDREDGTKLTLKIRENVKNNTITGYKISAIPEDQESPIWEYTSATGGGSGDNMRICNAHDTLLAAVYSPIATGCELVCVDMRTGKGIWIGDVKQLEVPHSQYRNEVYLRKIGNRIVLAGDEAGGNYLQVLDARTGKNLFHTLR